MERPLVSVVIPSYNHGPFVLEAVDSALRQSVSDLEVVVVDDGSTDGSPEKVSTLRDPRLRLEVQAHGGAHAAINRGLDLARGAYLAILNSDDAYRHDRLERLLEALRRRADAGIACSWLEVVDGAGKHLAVKEAWRNLEPWRVERPDRSFQATDDPIDNLLMANFVATTSNLLVRRETWEAVGPFRNLRYAHDWDWMLRATSHTTFAIVEQPLLRYRVHPGNTLYENRVAMIFEIALVLAENYHRYGGADRLDLEEPRALARRAARHFHSFFVYGHDRLFFVLYFLLESARRRGHSLAERLMQADDPTRLWFLERIREAETGRAAEADRPEPRAAERGRR